MHGKKRVTCWEDPSRNRTAALGSREMSLEKYQRARELITKAGGGDFLGPRPEALVARAEAALGLRFPPSYRQFLLDLGAGDVGGFEVYGIVDDSFDDARVPDAIALTLQARRSGLDPRYVMIGTLGDGSHDCLDTGHPGVTGEAPVVQLSSEYEDPVTLADSFGEYLLIEVEDALSDA
jgi:antitoxin YobK